MRLTRDEITCLQPTAVAYAAERGEVLGGIEICGDIDIESIEDFRRRCFGPASQLDEAEPSDGDECVHYIVIEPAA